jgi:hypothetical protein
VQVYLNGVPQLHVIRYDAERGIVVRFMYNECGYLYVGPDHLPMAAEFRGTVTVEETAGG